MSDVYQSLAYHLDRLPGGFPATESGVELRILRKLFSTKQAHVAAALSMRPETVEVIADRVKMSPDHIEAILDGMATKGLIFKIYKTPHRYMAAQFVIGIWEYQVNALDNELIHYFNEYVPYLSKQWHDQKTNQLRVIPISKSVNAEIKIMPYETAEAIIQTQSKIAVAPCICRKEHAMVGKGCDYPLEACLVFGAGAFYYEKNGIGRAIESSKALDILKKGMEAGLVLQPGNAKKAISICMCCGCCCQILKNVKALPRPAQNINSNYYSVLDTERCTGCGTCVERCHMDAISMVDVAVIDIDRCIGCGVCVPTCDTEALSLFAKPADCQSHPPETVTETYLSIAKKRGLI